jgi:hypothetical protein
MSSPAPARFASASLPSSSSGPEGPQGPVEVCRIHLSEAFAAFAQSPVSHPLEMLNPSLDVDFPPPDRSRAKRHLLRKYKEVRKKLTEKWGALSLRSVSVDDVRKLIPGPRWGKGWSSCGPSSHSASPRDGSKRMLRKASNRRGIFPRRQSRIPNCPLNW